jgi:hypothetical protein
VTMRRLRICIYGGTSLHRVPTEFVSALAYELLRRMPVIIVTGGFLHSKKSRDAISTDVAALKGAQRYAEESGIDLKDCFEAWIPEKARDIHADANEVVRMSEADGIALRVMTGRTPLGRRLAMVAGIDIVVTISGKVHTEIVIEHALELGRPVLPIPDAGGDSKDLLEMYRSRIASAFEPGALDRCLEQVSKSIISHPELASRAVVELIQGAKVGRCLVLFPYDDAHKHLYESVIEPAVAKQMIPVSLNDLPKSEVIHSSFADAMRTSSALIADITLLNENVMYEVGYAHGRGMTPLLYTRDAARLENLPVYFRTLNVRFAGGGMPLERLIDEYLRSVKGNPLKEL